MEIPIELPGWTIPAEAVDPAPVHEAEASLVAAARGGCEDAFQQLVHLHQNAIHRFCFHWLRDAEDAREACQDTFLRAWQALDRYEHRNRFSSWLFRIALNLCRDRHKSRAARERRQTRPLDATGLTLPCDGPGPDETVARSGDLEKLRRGIAALPDRQRAVLILCAQEGLSQEECAEVMNCSVRAVEGRYYRARQELIAWWHRND